MPAGHQLAREPDQATIELRGDEVFHLNILSYEHKPLRCDHLNAHYNATPRPLCTRLVAVNGR